MCRNVSRTWSLPGAGHVQRGAEELAAEQQGGRGVAAVALVAHPQAPGDQRLERDAPGAADGLADDRRVDVVDVQQPLVHALVVAAVVEPPRVLALVEVAETGVAMRRVLHHEHRHGRGVDPGQRADRAVVVAPGHGDRAGIQGRDRLLAGRRQALEQGAADDRLPLPALVAGPGQRSAGGEDQVPGVAGHHVDGQADVDHDRVGGAQPAYRLGVGFAERAHRATNPPSTRIVWAVM